MDVVNVLAFGLENWKLCHIGLLYSLISSLSDPTKTLKERKVVLHDIKGKAVSTTASFPTDFAGVTYYSLSYLAYNASQN